MNHDRVIIIFINLSDEILIWTILLLSCKIVDHIKMNNLNI
jgi:hypothetical protein